MQKKKILFVDDDPRLLDGLKRLLRKKRKEWEIFFANNGPEAIEVVGNNDLSVIVADMRMPGMNGAEVLKKVNQISPKTIRFILSGQACKELVLQAVNHAHIYLAKPCNQDHLLAVLERACSLHDLMLSSDVNEITTQIGSLPSIPALYKKLTDEINSEDASIENIGRIIGADPGMSSKILQVVNSAFFSLPRKLTTAKEATSVLGLDIISALVLTGEVFQQIDQLALKKFKLERLWSAANGTSAIARAIAVAEGSGKDHVNVCATVGMLHDIGKLLIASSKPEKFQEIMVALEEKTLSFEEAERQVLTASSTDIGAYLLGLWGLPSEVIRGVAYYRHPENDYDSSSNNSAAIIVHIGRVLECSLSGDKNEEVESTLDPANLNRIGVSEEKLAEWTKTAEGAMSAKA